MDMDIDIWDEDQEWYLSEDAAAIADCEALIASGYYDECMCGRNGDHGYMDEFDYEDSDYEDDYDYEI